jgi:hypothetical protein
LSNDSPGGAPRLPMCAGESERIPSELGRGCGREALLIEAVPGKNVLINGLLGPGKDDPRVGPAAEQFACDGNRGEEVSAAAAAGQEIQGGEVRGQGIED